MHITGHYNRDVLNSNFSNDDNTIKLIVACTPLELKRYIRISEHLRAEKNTA